ncbi:MAG: hypothetical protein EOP04_20135, partial [Proteobacteria bacterium]
MNKLLLFTILYSFNAFSAECKLGVGSYSSGDSGAQGGSKLGGPAVIAVFPYKCGGNPCNVEVGL